MNRAFGDGDLLLPGRWRKCMYVRNLFARPLVCNSSVPPDLRCYVEVIAEAVCVSKDVSVHPEGGHIEV